MKTIAHYKKNLLALCMVIAFSSPLVYAQSYTDSLQQDDQDIISSIAPYSADVRSTILDVAQYPQAIVKIERVQARSSQSFQDLIASYPREEQEKFYEISRFPDVLNRIISSDAGAPEIKTITKDLPVTTQNSFAELSSTHHDDLIRMNNIYQSSETALQKILAGYPDNVKNDFRKVIAMPDVMNLLTNNIGLTVELGEAYKADPAGVTQQLDSANTALAQQSKQDLDAYRKDVESNPELQHEMQQAATDFSNSNSQPDNPTYITNNYYDNTPYPYWFSYPYWYVTPIWYPRPMYYYTGFYYGPGGRIIVTGFPSRVYSNWFFGFGYRHYPTLYRHYGSYYSLHRTNVRTANVYRGFNDASYRHFNRGGFYNGGRTRMYSYPHRSQYRTNSNWGTMRMGQMHPNSFNNNGFSHFHANSFHSMGWQHVSSPRMNNGSRVGGGAPRSGMSGGSFHSGGMSHGGSFHGGGMSHGGGGGRLGR